MAFERQQPIRRHKDGSIDYGFYQRQGRLIRSQAARDLLTSLIDWAHAVKQRKLSNKDSKANASEPFA